MTNSHNKLHVYVNSCFSVCITAIVCLPSTCYANCLLHANVHWCLIIFRFFDNVYCHWSFYDLTIHFDLKYTDRACFYNHFFEIRANQPHSASLKNMATELCVAMFFSECTSHTKQLNDNNCSRSCPRYKQIMLIWEICQMIFQSLVLRTAESAFMPISPLAWQSRNLGSGTNPLVSHNRAQTSPTHTLERKFTWDLVRWWLLPWLIRWQPHKYVCILEPTANSICFLIWGIIQQMMYDPSQKRALYCRVVFVSRL